MRKHHGNRVVPQTHAHQLKVIMMTKELDKPKLETEAMASKAYELTRIISLGKAWGTYWGRIKCKSAYKILRELSKDKQQSTLIHKFGDLLHPFVRIREIYNWNPI